MPDRNQRNNSFGIGNIFPVQFHNSRHAPSMPPRPPHNQPPPPPSPHHHGNNPSGAPTSPPPPFIPTEAGITPFSLDTGAVLPCRFRFSYIWPRRGKPFWAWITFVGRHSFAGFRWDGRRWIYFAMDLRDVRSIQCF